MAARNRQETLAMQMRGLRPTARRGADTGNPPEVPELSPVARSASWRVKDCGTPARIASPALSASAWTPSTFPVVRYATILSVASGSRFAGVGSVTERHPGVDLLR